MKNRAKPGLMKRLMGDLAGSHPKRTDRSLRSVPASRTRQSAAGTQSCTPSRDAYLLQLGAPGRYDPPNGCPQADHRQDDHAEGIAGGGNRTHTLLPGRDFESRASASSATPA